MVMVQGHVVLQESNDESKILSTHLYAMVMVLNI